MFSKIYSHGLHIPQHNTTPFNSQVSHSLDTSSTLYRGYQTLSTHERSQYIYTTVSLTCVSQCPPFLPTDDTGWLYNEHRASREEYRLCLQLDYFSHLKQTAFFSFTIVSSLLHSYHHYHFHYQKPQNKNGYLRTTVKSDSLSSHASKYLLHQLRFGWKPWYCLLCTLQETDGSLAPIEALVASVVLP